MDFKGQHVIVLGLAKSGFSAAKLLHHLGANVTVTDASDLTNDPLANELRALNIQIIDTTHPLQLLDDAVMVVKNPGIPYKIPFLQQAMAKHIPIITEVELAYLINQNVIGITGTNGKTTTTSLIGDVFNRSDKTGHICGNIGIVASEVALATDKSHTLIMELSSFQLMGLLKFKPHIAAITNIFSAHLDYHGSQQDYVDAKMNIIKNQTKEDYLVFNLAMKNILQHYDIKSKIIFFSSTEKTNGAYVLNDAIYFQDEFIVETKNLALKGPHNIENALVCVAVCKLSGISSSVIAKTLMTFSSIEHRMQFVEEKDGVTYYNDSKATNTLATKYALSAFDSKIHWLCGGLDRGNGFDDLEDYISSVSHMYIFGETTNKLVDFARKHTIDYTICQKVDDAVFKTKLNTTQGDTVLLSPACASWDQYATFEERGEEFINAVRAL